MPSPATLPPPAPRKGLSTGCIIAVVVCIVGFVAVTVIAIMASLAIPAFSKVKSKAERANTRVTMKGLEIAIKGYQTEYNRLPLKGNSSPAAGDQNSDTTDPDGRALLDTLLGKDTVTNPRSIYFIDLPPARASGAGYSASSGLRDPWGKNGYRILLDANGDNRITDPEGLAGDLTATILIYSAGPDGDFTTWADNVCNWK